MESWNPGPGTAPYFFYSWVSKLGWFWLVFLTATSMIHLSQQLPAKSCKSRSVARGFMLITHPAFLFASDKHNPRRWRKCRAVPDSWAQSCFHFWSCSHYGIRRGDTETCMSLALPGGWGNPFKWNMCNHLHMFLYEHVVQSRSICWILFSQTCLVTLISVFTSLCPRSTVVMSVVVAQPATVILYDYIYI